VIDPSQLTPEQLEQVRKAIAAARARQQMQQAPSATNAFDLMRRRKAVEDAQRAAEAAKRAAEQGPDGQATEGGAGSIPQAGATASSDGPSDDPSGGGAATPSASEAGGGGGAGAPPQRPVQAAVGSSTGAPRARLGAGFEGVGRNDTCPCGSGKKFKKCHGQ
jgi:uncharacterized protein YecA (UPF0149 family)